MRRPYFAVGDGGVFGIRPRESNPCGIVCRLPLADQPKFWLALRAHAMSSLLVALLGVAAVAVRDDCTNHMKYSYRKRRRQVRGAEPLSGDAARARGGGLRARVAGVASRDLGLKIPRAPSLALM